MGLVQTILEYILHIDRHLVILIYQFGVWSYLLLFLIIFAETGLVVAPFLPGDSLIFTTGALAAIGSLNLLVLWIVFCSAAILGDSVNYAIGNYLGARVFKENSKIFKKEYLDRTQHFYDKYGGKTIIIARFVPVVRTFAPFLAGVGKMSYWKFIMYNVVGGIMWVSLFLFGGYFFGNIPFVQNHFLLAVIIIIVVSTIPVIVEIIRHRLKARKHKA